MTQGPVHSYIDKWLAAQPAQRLALVFVEPARREACAALAALQHELLQSACDIREPQVAASKLNWWVEELAGAPASGGRHPLTQVLFAAPTAADIPMPMWLVPMQIALAQLGAATPADFGAQLEASVALHAPFAALETVWWFGANADPARAASMAALGHLLRSIAHLGEQVDADRLPLPMARLARHGLDREALAMDSPQRDSALREQLTDISSAFSRAWTQQGPLSTFRGLDARLAQRGSRRAGRAAQPLSALHAVQSRQTGPATLWHAWQAARDARARRSGSP